MGDSIRKIHQWECRPTGYRRPEYRSVQPLLKIEEEKNFGEPIGFGTNDEYVWRIRFGMRFRANSAQLDHARENAARMLLHEIYGPIENEMRRALSACYGGDIESSIEAIVKALDIIEAK